MDHQHNHCNICLTNVLILHFWSDLTNTKFKSEILSLEIIQSILGDCADFEKFHVFVNIKVKHQFYENHKTGTKALFSPLLFTIYVPF